MFFELLGINKEDSQGNKGAPSGGQYNTEALEKKLDSAGPEVGTWNYYSNLRRTNPKAYYDPKVQNEMYENRRKMGEEKFFGR
jgi:hypothetical protein